MWGRGVSDPNFGECAFCGYPVERPFWDSMCFDCQDGKDFDEDDGYDDEPLSASAPVCSPPETEDD